MLEEQQRPDASQPEDGADDGSQKRSPDGSRGSRQHGAADHSAHIAIHSEGGVAAEHPTQEAFTLLVGPATEAQFNTLSPGLRVTACWCVDDLRFAFDSSFVAPEMAVELKSLAALAAKFPDNPVSIFAHADPVGDEEYNKKLSGRRATAIYALLTRNVALWEQLYREPLGSDVWGEDALRRMAHTVASPAETAPASGGDAPLPASPGDSPPPAPSSDEGMDYGAGCPLFLVYLDGASETPPDDDPNTPDTKPDTPADPDQRAHTCTHDAGARQELFRDYMDRLCGPDLLLPTTAFLGKGADPQGKGDYQGCGEFNPVLLFSQNESRRLAAPENREERNEMNAPNRRVLLFFFHKGTRIETGLWPCPRANEGTPGCRKRFWSDSARRRANGAAQREYPATHDTFACRFYDRLAAESPCETNELSVRIRLYDTEGNFIPGAPWQIQLGSQETRQGFASPRGFVRLRKVPGIASGTITWGAASDGQAADANAQNATEPPALFYEDAIFLDTEGDADTQAQRRLVNLGYDGDKLADQVFSFQTDYQDEYGLHPNGVLDANTLNAIRTVHDTMADRLRSDKSPSN